VSDCENILYHDEYFRSKSLMIDNNVSFGVKCFRSHSEKSDSGKDDVLHHWDYNCFHLIFSTIFVVEFIASLF
jgi:hypothetical protein